MPNRCGPRAHWWGPVLAPSGDGLTVEKILEAKKLLMENDSWRGITSGRWGSCPQKFTIGFDLAIGKDMTATELRMREYERFMNPPVFIKPMDVAEIDRIIRDTLERKTVWGRPVKENSNMNSTNNTTSVEVPYSNNCAVKALQVQLERAIENKANHQRSVDQYQQDMEYYKHRRDVQQAEVDRCAKYEKELKAALKKLGASPRIV